jgi:transcriptional regulator with XRE-family HTH domain
MRSQGARKKASATNARNLRTLLLLNVFEPEEIGDRIKQARDRAGLRQEDLADLIGMSTRQIQNYEAGESKQYAKLRAIAEATGVRVEWLLHGDEETVSRDEELHALREELGEVRGELAEVHRLLEERLPAVREDQPQAV